MTVLSFPSIRQGAVWQASLVGSHMARFLSNILDRVLGSPHTKWLRSQECLTTQGFDELIPVSEYVSATLRSLGTRSEEALISCDCSMSVHATEMRRSASRSEGNSLRWSFTLPSFRRAMQWQKHLGSYWTRQLHLAKPWPHIVLVINYSARNQSNHSKASQL